MLTSIRRTKKGIVTKESDHNVILTTFKDKFNDSKNREKVHVYNLKNIDCQNKFKEYTSDTKMLSSVLDSREDINTLTNRLLKKINGCIAVNFRKVRVNHTKKGPVEKLYDELNTIKEKGGSEVEVNEVKEKIVNLNNEKYKKISEELAKKKDGRKLNPQKFWKIRKQICPKSQDPPSAMLDEKGNLLTTQKVIENKAIDVYTKRLEGNEIKAHLKDAEKMTETLCETRLKTTQNNKTDPWTMEDLENAIKDLQRNKSRDALEQANELFKEEVAGDDFKLAILKLMNMIKTRLQYPEGLEQCNITSIYKNKGSRKEFNSYRGVFRVTVLRSILDRLTYNDSYYTIDDNLSDGNVGARKERNIRDKIFVIGAISNSVLNGKQPPIQITITDVEKCFDKLWLEAAINSLYEAG